MQKKFNPFKITVLYSYKALGILSSETFIFSIFSKTTLNILYNPDKVFNISECGENALDIIYSLENGRNHFEVNY